MVISGGVHVAFCQDALIWSTCNGAPQVSLGKDIQPFRGRDLGVWSQQIDACVHVPSRRWVAYDIAE
jgi:hypothetical protein